MSLTVDDKWSQATFRAFSTMVTASEIQLALGLPPTWVEHMGQPISKRVPTRRRAHAFFIESGLPKSEPLDRHLVAICDLLEPVRDRLQTLRATCECDIFCGFSSGNGQGGFSIDASLLRRLAALQLSVSLDLYPPSEITSAE